MVKEVVLRVGDEERATRWNGRSSHGDLCGVWFVGTGTRGTAAKGGAGGKGTWGRADDPSAQLQAATDPAYLDKNDPNYVEDESGGDELLTADDA